MRILKLLFRACLIFTMLALFVPNVQASKNPEGPDKTVKIGLLIHDNKSVAAKHGAEMAVRKANEKGGFNGRPFQLVVHSMEGPWGTGSKEAVNLIFEEEVWAIMGSHDGRNAHLVEQVTTKARIVFLSAWASDPTLSQAFVPWYFSCVPNDLQQAAAFIEEIYNKRKITKIATVADNGYDSKLALDSFLKETKIAGKADPLQFFYENSSQDFNVLLDQIYKADVNCIILFGQPLASLKIIQQIRQRKMTQPVFGSLSVLGENELSGQEWKNFEGVVLVSSGHLLRSQGLDFRQEFQRTYGNMPGAEAAYAFDGMNLIIEAIRNAGLDRDKIQKSLAKIHYNGVTGEIRFDDKGNRVGTAELMKIKNGIPVAVGGD
ncbi:MAG: ABC transporter substrate-binding protein [Actinobacteria bacterium]|nr:ABC transporter substrate-binding protein [Actinomycetota bacterium]